MKGSELRYLAGVADLARLDLEAASATLIATGGDVTAIYRGLYAYGDRVVRGTKTEPFTAHINAAQFKALAAMFVEDDEVRLSYDPKRGVSLSSKQTATTLKEWGEAVDHLSPPDLKSLEMQCSISGPALASELETALDFVSESHTRPAFTGIRLAWQRSAMRVMAYDGVAALYLSIVPDIEVKGQAELILPAKDIALGGKLIAENAPKKTMIEKPKGEEALYIYNAKSLFRSPTVRAEWPNTSELTAEMQESTSFDVESAQIKNLTAGVRVFGAGPDIDVSEIKGRVLFQSRSDMGSFTTAVRGSLKAPLKYDAETLSKVTKLGPVLRFHVPDQPYKPTIVQAGHRKCWVQTRI